MASILEFSREVRQLVGFAVMGAFSVSYPVQPFRPEGLQQGRAGSLTVREELSYAVLTKATPNDPTNVGRDLYYGLSPGSKLTQCLTTYTIDDPSFDANAVSTIASVNVLVTRLLIDAYDANLYENEEMLENQRLLLQVSLWQDLSQLEELIEGPEIAESPVRSSNAITYEMNFEARVVSP